MIEQLVSFVIRPPRAEYDLETDLLGPDFSLKGRRYHRNDIQLVNARGHTLQCSHYAPNPPLKVQLPCVIYCHGNSGCRADANEAAVLLLPSNITVFALDFAGSGMSGGEYVSLGKYEMDDLVTVVDHLRVEGRTSLIGLWGRSMGAVTALLYGATDPSIAGMVLDSPFTNLHLLIMELVDVYRIKLPKFTVKLAVAYMRRLIRQRAHFDIHEIDTLQAAARCFIPAVFAHAEDDDFIQPHHSDDIFKVYVGDKNKVQFEGDHNSQRPPFFFDSTTIFFHNTLHPPPVDQDSNLSHAGATSQHGSDYEADDNDAIDQAVLYELISTLGREEKLPESTAAAAATAATAAAGGSSEGAEAPRGRYKPGGNALKGEEIAGALEQAHVQWHITPTTVPVSESSKRSGEEEEVQDLAAILSEPQPSSASSSSTAPSTSTATPVPGPAPLLLEEFVQQAEAESLHYPATEDDEERMLMEAIAQSLKEQDLGDSNRQPDGDQGMKRSRNGTEGLKVATSGGSNTPSGEGNSCKDGTAEQKD